MAIGFSWGTTKLSYPFIMYILVSVCLGLYLVKYMYTLNKEISAMIVFVLLILTFLFFGKRWFQYGQLKGTSAWTQMNSAIQSGSASATAEQCGGVSSASVPTSWPPVVNYCPDFMTIDGSGKCVDSNKLYGTTSLGQTQIAKYTGNTNVCSSVTDPAKSMYLRWEGVVQAEGSCSPGNIGKKPSN